MHSPEFFSTELRTKVIHRNSSNTGKLNILHFQLKGKWNPQNFIIVDKNKSQWNCGIMKFLQSNKLTVVLPLLKICSQLLTIMLISQENLELAMLTTSERKFATWIYQCYIIFQGSTLLQCDQSSMQIIVRATARKAMPRVMSLQNIHTDGVLSCSWICNKNCEKDLSEEKLVCNSITKIIYECGNNINYNPRMWT